MTESQCTDIYSNCLQKYSFRVGINVTFRIAVYFTSQQSISFFDTSTILRTELHSIKIQVRRSNQITKSMAEKLRSAESENARLQSKNKDLKTKLQENSKRSDIYVCEENS